MVALVLAVYTISTSFGFNGLSRAPNLNERAVVLSPSDSSCRSSSGSLYWHRHLKVRGRTRLLVTIRVEDEVKTELAKRDAISLSSVAAPADTSVGGSKSNSNSNKSSKKSVSVASSASEKATAQAPAQAQTQDVSEVGGGAACGRPHTEDSKAKISRANKGKVPWNIGKKHSPETKAKIARKTREAMLRRKQDKAEQLGLSIEAYEQRILDEKRRQKASKPKGITPEGRRRISEALKRRWSDPEFRETYTKSMKGNRSHSKETRERISEAIRNKWKDQEYRAKIVRNTPSDEVKSRISATLKAKWEEPEFRRKMLNSTFERTDSWRQAISDGVRAKWSDPAYRQAVLQGVAANRDSRQVGGSGSATVPRRRSSSNRSKPKMRPEEIRRRRNLKRAEHRAKDKARRDLISAAKKEQSRGKGGAGAGAGGGAGATGAGVGKKPALKDLLGGELWLEEKLRRGDPFLDDDDLERQLSVEDWDSEDEVNSGRCPLLYFVLLCFTLVCQP